MRVRVRNGSLHGCGGSARFIVEERGGSSLSIYGGFLALSLKTEIFFAKKRKTRFLQQDSGFFAFSRLKED